MSCLRSLSNLWSHSVNNSVNESYAKLFAHAKENLNDAFIHGALMLMTALHIPDMYVGDLELS